MWGSAFCRRPGPPRRRAIKKRRTQLDFDPLHPRAVTWGRALHEALRAFHTLNTIAFIALGAVALVGWRRRRDSASGWAVAAFGSLGLLELLSLIPQHARDDAYQAITRIEIEILVVFPYLLFRFTNAFRRPGRGLGTSLFALTTVLIVWTLA